MCGSCWAPAQANTRPRLICVWYLRNSDSYQICVLQFAGAIRSNVTFGAVRASIQRACTKKPDEQPGRSRTARCRSAHIQLRIAAHGALGVLVSEPTPSHNTVSDALGLHVQPPPTAADVGGQGQ